MSDREFDVVIFGASGYTGKLVAEYMHDQYGDCLLYTSPSPRDGLLSRMPSSA